jgi:NAD(P)H-dependent flavin oxidoreductase YrpB (nitropropane dioxygenase family)
VLERFGSSLPVVAAPMAGGPTTPALVAAAAEAGFGGFLAAGYKSPETLSDEVEAMRRTSPSFGVNVFAPPVVPVDPAAYAAYRELLLPLAERLEVDLPPEPVEDDDHWQAKVDLLAELAPPVVSFTFGIPDAGVVGVLHRAGIALVQTVTSPDEARQAAEAGLDGLVVQSADAGGHWGTLTPASPPPRRPLADLVRAVRATVDLPLLAAGGVGTVDDVRAALAAGAEAVVVGTALLLAEEAGTNPAHRAGLVDGRTGPVTTAAFSGRPAGALPNGFVAEYGGLGPLGYPAVHHLTSPIRRAAAAAADPEHVNLWAGAGHRHARGAPVAEILRGLLP